jgi:purine-nucleoside phosphorylase
MSEPGQLSAEVIRQHADLPFEVGIVLGSGLGGLGDRLQDPVRIPYAKIPGFPRTTVSSHAGEVVAGWLEDVAVVVYSGRSHYFESQDITAMREPVAALRALGCDTQILTNAAGSLRSEVGPGEVMLISDHINFSGANPLIGEHGDDRFVSMTAAYDAGLRADLFGAAEREGLALATGVYMYLAGPSFETPAEIRMIARAGADAVGMSTVPEVILGRFFGLRCAGISSIVNFAAGMTGADISHEETKTLAPIGARKIERILQRYLRDRREKRW